MPTQLLWNQCRSQLKKDISSEEFSTWISPLQSIEEKNNICLLAPNQFVLESVKENYLEKIKSWLSNHNKEVELKIGRPSDGIPNKDAPTHFKSPSHFGNNINASFTFETFVEGKTNQMAHAACIQVASNLGKSYNPLFIYGDVGLGKTHLMQAIGNSILAKKPTMKIAYVHSERFVQDMVNAIRNRLIDQFKARYRSLDMLLIDDIQFFSKKEQSQEEFFHTFNTLIEEQNQIVLTCDRYPKEVHGLEERLKSRFGWGLTTKIEPPELETRIAILNKKAEMIQLTIPDEVCSFIARRFKSNVRELEGALNRVVAYKRLTNKPFSIDTAKQALHDLIVLQDEKITLENIKKITAEYYNIRLSDLVSKRRTRSLVRPRQIAMTVAKELTSHSLPEIGESFGGRDHTTVLHAYRTINNLMDSNQKIKEDYKNLTNLLTI